MEELKYSGIFYGRMEGTPLTRKELDRRTHHLELYLEEHPQEDNEFTREIKNVLQRTEQAFSDSDLLKKLRELHVLSRRIRKQESIARENAYRTEWKDYAFYLDWLTEENPASGLVRVILQKRDGQEIAGHFPTLEYIRRSLREQDYFSLPHMVVMESITQDTIRRTIDDLVNTYCIKSHFAPVLGQPSQEDVASVRERFKDPKQVYVYNLDLPILSIEDGDCSVVVKKDGITYWTSFTTPTFIQRILEKDKVIGESAQGTYFAMGSEGFIVVHQLTNDTFRRVVDDLTAKGTLDQYFTSFEESD